LNTGHILIIINIVAVY